MSSLSPNCHIILLIAETRFAGDEGQDKGHHGSASFKHDAKKKKKILLDLEMLPWYLNKIQINMSFLSNTLLGHYRFNQILYIFPSLNIMFYSELL